MAYYPCKPSNYVYTEKIMAPTMYRGGKLSNVSGHW
jgi:hypothetical protein